jgi:hypothetical protein
VGRSLSNKRTGVSFTIAAGPRQRSHLRVRVPWHSRPYFTVSDSRLPFLSPPTTRRAAVEVFDPPGRWTKSKYHLSEKRRALLISDCVSGKAEFRFRKLMMWLQLKVSWNVLTLQRLKHYEVVYNKNNIKIIVGEKLLVFCCCILLIIFVVACYMSTGITKERYFNIYRMLLSNVN